MRPRPENREGFITRVTTQTVPDDARSRFPMCLPMTADLDKVVFHPAVTFFIGENGSGKSTLLEAMAVRLGFEDTGGDAEVGNRNRFDHREQDGGLHDFIQLDFSRTRRVGDRFFLRAETVFDMASKLEKSKDPGALDRYGIRSLHTRSHGEAFLAIIQNRMRPESLLLMDEPEAALSPTRQLTLIKEIDWLVRAGCQFVIATHSPILMAYPDAVIYELGADGLRQVVYEETEHYELTKSFLNHPDAYLRHLVE